MSSTLILIKDIINNKEFIYSTESSHSFDNCISYLKNTYKLENVNYSIHDTFCEIFLENETLQKGWIWNSTETTKQVIYILSLVPVLDTQPKLSVTTETQTTTTTTSEKSTQTTQDVSPLELQYRYYTNQDRLFDHFNVPSDSLDTNFTYTNHYTNHYTIDPLQICKRPEQKNNSPILNILTKELKSKLQLPNYGLKNTKFDLM